MHWVVWYALTDVGRFRLGGHLSEAGEGVSHELLHRGPLFGSSPQALLEGEKTVVTYYVRRSVGYLTAVPLYTGLASAIM